jgi:hypothetical protein
MNSDYRVDGPSQTMGSVLISIGIAAAAVAAPAPQQFPYTPHVIPAFEAFGTTSANSFSYGLEPRGVSVQEHVGQFYERLQAAQEPLGFEFETVLLDNLWSLYSRS